MVVFFQQEHLLSDENIVKYFSSFFIELGQTENNEVPIDFHHFVKSLFCSFFAIDFNGFHDILLVSLFFLSVFMEAPGSQQC